MYVGKAAPTSTRSTLAAACEKSTRLSKARQGQSLSLSLLVFGLRTPLACEGRVPATFCFPRIRTAVLCAPAPFATKNECHANGAGAWQGRGRGAGALQGGGGGAITLQGPGGSATASWSHLPAKPATRSRRRDGDLDCQGLGKWRGGGWGGKSPNGKGGCTTAAGGGLRGAWRFGAGRFCSPDPAAIIRHSVRNPGRPCGRRAAGPEATIVLPEAPSVISPPGGSSNNTLGGTKSPASIGLADAEPSEASGAAM